MKKVLDEKILEEANSWIKSNYKVALVTVIKTWGSSPRQVGSKMIINENGDFSGSVSGGCVEASVIITPDTIPQLPVAVGNVTAVLLSITPEVPIV